MHSYVIIGITDADDPQLSSEALSAIGRGSVFSGGRRHHEIVRPLLPAGHTWIDIAPPLDAVFARYAACYGEIVVFASGDPLFFGFANTVLRRDPRAAVRVLPAFNSLQLLAHRLLLPYQDMRCLSLVGRDWHQLDRALIERVPLVGILTDGRHGPEAVARRMLDYGYGHYTMMTGERLGGSQERVRTLLLSDAAGEQFVQPCCVILRATEEMGPRRWGIPDNEFALLDGRDRMITKMPIRLLALQALDLGGRRVLWDVGFCTGSVSIEARLQWPHVQVVAFERREEGRSLMSTNSRRFGAPGIGVSIGDFLDADLRNIARPDAVFIGGHGGRLGDMLRRVDEVITAGGRVVMNSVTPQSRVAFERLAAGLGWQLLPPATMALNDYNPITILSADVHHSC